MNADEIRARIEQHFQTREYSKKKLQLNDNFKHQIYNVYWIYL